MSYGKLKIFFDEHIVAKLSYSIYCLGVFTTVSPSSNSVRLIMSKNRTACLKLYLLKHSTSVLVKAEDWFQLLPWTGIWQSQLYVWQIYRHAANSEKQEQLSGLYSVCMSLTRSNRSICSGLLRWSWYVLWVSEPAVQHFFKFYKSMGDSAILCKTGDWLSCS